MKFLPAISAYIQTQIPGLYAFKDDLAFYAAGNPYPYFLADVISQRKLNLGTGVWDKTIPLGNDNFLKAKIIKNHIVVRFTIRAVSESNRNGNEAVSSIADQMELLLFDMCRQGIGKELPIPDSEEKIYVEKSVFQGRSDVAPLEKGMPFVYQISLSFLFIIHEYLTEEVTSALKTININL